MVQLLHPCMTTGKTIALTRQNFVGKVMSLLFNMLSRLVIAFLPRSKRLLISWLQSPSAVILEPRKIKSSAGCHDLSFLNIDWRDWCWSWNSNTLATWCEEVTYWKRPWCWERLKAGGGEDNRGCSIGWHHRLNEHEFEQVLGIGVGKGSLACCSPWGCKELDMTVWLHWTEG